MQRSIIYTRVSSDQQIDNTSLAQQEKICSNYCIKNKIQIVKVFREEGESARFIDRTKLKEALKFCAISSNLIQYFIVYKYDRFSRSVENHHYIKAILNRYSVQVVSVTEPIDNSPSGHFMENVLAAAAQFDNEIRVERCISGIKAKFSEGYYLYKPPLGYKKDFTYRGNGCKPIIKDNESFNILKQGWDMLIHDGDNVRYIAEQLKKKGLKGIKGNLISEKTLYRIFQNKFYYGIVEIPKLKIKVKGKHIPMISEDDYYAAQYALKTNSHNYTNPVTKYNPIFPLAKTLLCSKCGKKLVGYITRGKYRYYKCYNKNCKDRQHIRADIIEEEFYTLLTTMKLKPSFIEIIKKYVINKIENKLKLSLNTIKYLKRNETEIKNKISKLDEFLENGIYTPKKYKDRLNKLEYELFLIKEEIDKNNITRKYNKEHILTAIKFLENIANYWFELSIQGKIALNKIIFKDGLKFEKLSIANSKKVRNINVKSPLNVLNSHRVPTIRQTCEIIEYLLSIYNILRKFSFPHNL